VTTPLGRRSPTPALEKIVLCTLALIAFGGGTKGPFVFDDLSLPVDPIITSTSGWWESWMITQTRPLTWFTFWLNYQVGGEDSTGYHIVSLAAHLGVIWLLLDVLRELLGSRTGLVAVSLFAVHPLLTESVVYIFSRGILLAAIFSLLAIRSWIRGDAWRAVAYFGVAMLAKEECASIPVVLALLDKSRGEPQRWGPLSAMAAIALALALRVIWVISFTPGAPAGGRAGITSVSYLATQGVVILRYLQLAIIPWGFSVDHEISQPAAISSLAAWLLIAGLSAVAWRSVRNLGPGFWFLATIILLMPSSSIFPAADVMAERRMYLPLMTLSASLTLAGESSVGKRLFKLRSGFWRPVWAAAVFLLVAISIRYTMLWRQPALLWAEAVQLAPTKARPRLQLARTLELHRALALLGEAALLAPRDPAIAMERGRVLFQLGLPSEALTAFGQAYELDPSDSKPLNNQGVALAAMGRGEEAVTKFRHAISQTPCLFDPYLNLMLLGTRTSIPSECRLTPKQKEILQSNGYEGR
jgi:protein O-mannosyl-transferase